jgi:hypothetical protein
MVSPHSANDLHTSTSSYNFITICLTFKLRRSTAPIPSINDIAKIYDVYFLSWPHDDKWNFEVPTMCGLSDKHCSILCNILIPPQLLT